jgi:hypothetical protein
VNVFGQRDPRPGPASLVLNGHGRLELLINNHSIGATTNAQDGDNQKYSDNVADMIF